MCGRPLISVRRFQTGQQQQQARSFNCNFCLRENTDHVVRSWFVIVIPSDCYIYYCVCLRMQSTSYMSTLANRTTQAWHCNTAHTHAHIRECNSNALLHYSFLLLWSFIAIRASNLLLYTVHSYIIKYEICVYFSMRAHNIAN